MNRNIKLAMEDIDSVFHSLYDTLSLAKEVLPRYLDDEWTFLKWQSLCASMVNNAVRLLFRKSSCPMCISNTVCDTCSYKDLHGFCYEKNSSWVILCSCFNILNQLLRIYTENDKQKLCVMYCDLLEQLEEFSVLIKERANFVCKE